MTENEKQELINYRMSRVDETLKEVDFLVDKRLARFYTDLYDKRQTSDYDDFIDFTKEDVLSLIPTAKELIGEIKKLLEIE